MPVDIIEIIGPPGIGKTTMYNALCKNWRSSMKWTHQNAIVNPIPLLSDLNNWIRYHAKKLFKMDLSKSVPLEFGIRFAQSNPALVNFCWRQLSDENVFTDEMGGLRFRSGYLLYLDFCRYQAITELRPMVPCLLNEGLLQKSFLVQADIKLLPDLLHTYLSLVPLPRAVICINTDDIGLIVDRLIKRPKVIASHIGKNKNDLHNDIIKWQFQLNLIGAALVRHHVPVYTIDGARSIKENVSIITQRLEEQKSFEISNHYPNGKIPVLR